MADFVICPHCGADLGALGPGDRFCEDCGAKLSDEPAEPVAGACIACGATEIDADGFCTRCGVSQPVGRNRVEVDLASAAAAVSDRGRRHFRNEDAVALRSVPERADTVVAVVCDGVSTSDRPDDAAKAAADAACAALVDAVLAGEDLVAATGSAVGAAVSAVVELAGSSDPDNAPACTYVSAVVSGDRVVVGWVGDSRAYWLAEPGESRCLTTDDSWAERMVAAGTLPAEQAFADPRSHALVAWLGADAGTITPHVTTFEPEGPGVVLVCTDGLWNYLWGADALAGLVLPGGMAEPFGAAKALTMFALEAGGHDNITVAVVPCPSRSGQEQISSTQVSSTQVSTGSATS